eukprot:TRINITY_DN12768_c0_g1_i3.p1 TRINITY_DN12768_c0_g1~~TRINITY_DN12768_c0_g1_i3.p1  ORF type:complete len:475 (+),score=131.15 TRINITY_DN12768_c0_g1_i3:69-1493(+)
MAMAQTSPALAAAAPDAAEQAREAWNHYLDGDRDRAPGDYIAEWLHRHAQAGLDVAMDYARLAQERVGVLSAGKSFLDQGGAAVQAPILAKKTACNAVEQDSALLQQLTHLSRLNAQEMHFAVDPAKHDACARAAHVYAQAVELLKGHGAELPPAPTWGSKVEQDAGMIMQFRVAKADIGKYVGLASSPIALGPSPAAKSSSAAAAPPQRSSEELIRELFRLHDLNANGVLEEEELVKLNEKVHLLHYGKDAGLQEVRTKYRDLFRGRLDARGKPVAFEVFERYMREVLLELDTDPRAQIMILEQFIAEAESAREAFRFQSLASVSDAPFLAHLGIERPPVNTAAGDGRTPAAAAATPASASSPGSRDGNAGKGGYSGGEGAETGKTAAAAAGGSAAAEAARKVVRVPYKKGDAIQVWSNSKKTWLDGSVQEVYETDTWSQGYAVPAGTIKVVSKAGSKWIMPKQASEVRKLPT